MACGCGKNRGTLPRAASGFSRAATPRSGVTTGNGSRNTALRTSGLAPQPARSASGMNAQQRRTQALRRQTINRNAKK